MIINTNHEMLTMFLNMKLPMFHCSKKGGFLWVHFWLQWKDSQVKHCMPVCNWVCDLSASSWGKTGVEGSSLMKIVPLAPNHLDIVPCFVIREVCCPDIGEFQEGWVHELGIRVYYCRFLWGEVSCLVKIWHLSSDYRALHNSSICQGTEPQVASSVY